MNSCTYFKEKIMIYLKPEPIHYLSIKHLRRLNFRSITILVMIFRCTIVNFELLRLRILTIKFSIYSIADLEGIFAKN